MFALDAIVDFIFADIFVYGFTERVCEELGLEGSCGGAFLRAE
jgi:hypothetical protein